MPRVHEIPHYASLTARREFEQQLNVQPASAQAQANRGGLGIEHVRRGVLFKELANLAGNITVTAGAAGVFSSLSTPLEGEIHLTGRPLLVKVAGIMLAGTSGSLRLGLAIDGVDPIKRDNGIPGTYSAVNSPLGFTGIWFIQKPSAGISNIEVRASALTADGLLYATAGSTLTLIALEV